MINFILISKRNMKFYYNTYEGNCKDFSTFKITQNFKILFIYFISKILFISLNK